MDPDSQLEVLVKVPRRGGEDGGEPVFDVDAVPDRELADMYPEDPRQGAKPLVQGVIVQPAVATVPAAGLPTVQPSVERPRSLRNLWQAARIARNDASSSLAMPPVPIRSVRNCRISMTEVTQ
jgi:hypothetical protein